MEIKHVGVFCAASDQLDAAYYTMARAFGRWLGERKLTLVYGGADSGLMECVAEGVEAAGGRTVGVVPRILESKRRVSRLVDEVVPCNDLADRKAIIVSHYLINNNPAKGGHSTISSGSGNEIPAE